MPGVKNQNLKHIPNKHKLFHSAGFSSLRFLISLAFIILGVSGYLAYGFSHKFQGSVAVPSKTALVSSGKNQKVTSHSASFAGKTILSFNFAADELKILPQAWADFAIFYKPEISYLAQEQLAPLKQQSRQLADFANSSKQTFADIESGLSDEYLITQNSLAQMPNQLMAFGNGFTENLKAPYIAAWQVKSPALQQQREQLAWAVYNAKNGWGDLGLFYKNSLSDLATLEKNSFVARKNQAVDLAINFWNGTEENVGLLDKLARNDFGDNSVYAIIPQSQHLSLQTQSQQSFFAALTKLFDDSSVFSGTSHNDKNIQGQVLSANTSVKSPAVKKPVTVSLDQQVKNILYSYIQQGLFGFNSSNYSPDGTMHVGVAGGNNNLPATQAGGTTFSGPNGIIQNSNGQSTGVIGGVPIISYIPSYAPNNFAGTTLAGFGDLSANNFSAQLANISGNLTVQGGSSFSSGIFSGSLTAATTSLSSLTVSGNTNVGGSFSAGTTTLTGLTVNGPSVFNGSTTIAGLTVVGFNPGLQVGSVAFQNASGLSEDNSNFFYDATNHRLGLGTTTPSQLLTVAGNSLVTGNATTSGSSNIGGNLTVNGSSNITAGLNVVGNSVLATTTVTKLTFTNASGTNLSLTGNLSAANLSGSNSGDVTLAGQNYLSLSGQQITANLINLGTNVTGVLPVLNGGTGTTTLGNLSLGAGLSFGVGDGKLSIIGTSTTINLGTNVVTTLSTGTSGSIFNGSISANTLTLNLPFASIINTGQLQASDFLNFNNKLSGSLTNGFLIRATGASTTTNSILADNGLVAGVNASSSTVSFNVQGTTTLDPFNVASSSGTSLFIVKANGNVGIGTTSPGQKLDVIGSIRTISEGAGINAVGNSFMVQRSTDDSVLYSGFRTTPDAWVIGASYSTTGAYKPIILATSDTARMSILTNGNVGIGTTSPTSKLYVQGSGDTVIRLDNGLAGGEAVLGFKDGGLDQWKIGINSGIAGNILEFRDINATGGSGDRMVIDQSGNVGIGTTTPGAKLDVNGQVLIGDGSRGAQSAFPLYITASSNLGWKVADGSGVSKFELYTGYGGINQMRLLGGETIAGYAQDLTLGTDNNINSVTIQRTSGNVGVGTTTPQAQLVIKAAGSSVGLIVQGSNGSAHLQDWYQAGGGLAASIGDDGGFGVKDGSKICLDALSPCATYMQEISGVNFVSGAGRNITFNSSGYDAFLAGGSEAMRIINTGNVGIGTTTPTLGPLTMGSGAYVSAGGVWTNASDRNLKENFASVSPTSILQGINSLSVTEWNYKSEDPSIKHIGPVAQDFYSIFHVGNSDKSISTIDPSGIALLGIQALDQKINALQGNLTGNATATNLSVYIPSNFSGDSVGEAKILAGQTSVRVTFSQAYQYQPIVTFSAADIGGGTAVAAGAYISNANANGFTIQVPTSTILSNISTDMTFNWHSFASPQAQLTVSNGSTSPIALVVDNSAAPTNPIVVAPPTGSSSSGQVLGDSTTTQTSTTTPDTSASTTPPLILTPSPTPTATVTPTPSPVSTVTPIPSATPTSVPTQTPAPTDTPVPTPTPPTPIDTPSN